METRIVKCGICGKDLEVKHQEDNACGDPECCGEATNGWFSGECSCGESFWKEWWYEEDSDS